PQAGGEDAGFAWYVTGNRDDVSTDTRGLLVLQGGGDDVDANYVRMGEFAGGGDFVVLRASGADEYNDYIHALCACDSVETVVFASREAAFDPFVLGRLGQAEAIFIAGGDQSNYVRYWKDTPVEDAIHAVAAKPAPVGGTSAGMAIMGEFAYSAMTPASLTSDVALADPYATDLTLERDFLHFAGLEGILTDQHLIERDRIGRTLTMLARLIEDGWAPAGKAVAADRETAVHLDPETGLATVYATAGHTTPYAYFILADGAPAVCRPGVPLTMPGLSVYRVGPGGGFDTRAWAGTGGIAYTFDVRDGQLTSSRGEIY
ncbi:MAG TPA: cyanophycinase, partial [Woeseiaceae bacterium]|nr:cyanophycinase [Woeseiaceae bacterium]